ncbi:hypothetical protein DUNSADRAFT_10542 [Dunaliella salina]|uniref:Peptidase M41 domain-containing protein n=1 Tax=Dunaliella salina TaxID=3046 RepID=A0ABQ7GF08_DUNSA|nr:hypothetical protein DUNSADRAFT_10542 [Dunaliella salina]|eukprot:KAF5833192.1 hypothetical protein DUNSADRAFT_10542 [Dunaliella salina]
MDMETEMLLNNSYKTVKEILARNRACLDQLTELLIERERIDGYEVREIVEQNAAEADLAARREEAGLALL